MKKLLLILLCVPLMFSCGENEKDNKNQGERRSEILTNQEARNVNNINNPCDCNDMQYVVLKDIIDLADGRIESEIKKNEQDSILLMSLWKEYQDIANICSEMYQKLGDTKFYQNHTNCKYSGLNRNLRIQLSELGFFHKEEKSPTTIKLIK